MTVDIVLLETAARGLSGFKREGQRMLIHGDPLDSISSSLTWEMRKCRGIKRARRIAAYLSRVSSVLNVSSGERSSSARIISLIILSEQSKSEVNAAEKRTDFKFTISKTNGQIEKPFSIITGISLILPELPETRS